jgi:hypothetical protein
MGTTKSDFISTARVSKGEICDSTITNYYKATKPFCIMNDLVLNWKKIARGLPGYAKHLADN